MRVLGIVCFSLLVGCGAADHGEDEHVRFSPTTDADDALPLYVVHGSQWVWGIELPTGDRVTNELVLPIGQPVRIQVVSDDVEHRWVVDGTPLRIDVPAHGSVTRRVEALAAGDFHTVCRVSCGPPGVTFTMSVRFVSPEQSQRWMEGRDLPSGVSPAVHGRELYASAGCTTCHEGSLVLAGELRGIGGTTRSFEDGTSILLDAAHLDPYLRESIASPDAHVVRGSAEIHMPHYSFRPGDLDALVAYTSCIATGCGARAECAGACDTSD